MTGDVSLTIINTNEKDSGIYGCRMQHSGPFNDGKIEITLTIKKAPTPPTPRTPDVTSHNWDYHTHAPVPPTSPDTHTWDYHTHDYLTESSSQNLESSTRDINSESIHLNWIYTSIKLVLIGMVIASALVFRKRCKRIAMVFKIPQNSGDTVGYRSSESIPEDTQVVIDNIYEMTE
ncbi:hypothetical protein DPEC_G00227520 [Dallia pectoralis]|uniref:Uncharacterized protein n=1 Tax=Dallia pectoralis TaxID=75939 RepID=A0ACC2G0N1_DALPE|nr:hypothetical protein DPEC_G00227520 [Dallia pectoralis]